MEKGGYRIRNQHEIHFVSFAVVEWVDVFTRKLYCDILIDSLVFCQNSKGLRIHGWCIMSNHVHLMISSVQETLSDILRDFKKFTSSQILKVIRENAHESRRNWMLQVFKKAGQENSRNSIYQFWRQNNQPKECYTNTFTFQKLNYIHNNPVQAGIVLEAWHYLYSSAKAYHTGQQYGLLHINFI